jgi:hypothetical protein
MKRIAKEFTKKVGQDLKDLSALELRVSANLEIEELESLLLKSTTALFEIKKLLTAGGTLLQFFDGVEQVVTTKAAREVLHWKRKNGKQIVERAAQRRLGTPTGRISSSQPEFQELPAPKKIPRFSGQKTWCKLNIGCYQEPKTAGFWRESAPFDPKERFPAGQRLPFPVRMKLETFDLDAFLTKLEKVEAKAHRNHFKGWSTNRWDGSQNGSCELKYKGWRWPVGYRTYIEGGLLPSKTFFKFIMGYELEGLPAF